jgi:outer membrane protein insertion porin family
LLSAFLGWTNLLCGQNEVKIIFAEQQKTKSFPDSLSASVWVNTYLAKQQNKGYANIKTTYNINNEWVINKGSKFIIESIYLDSVLIQKEGILSKYNNRLTNTVNSKANQGYPFYRIKADSLSVSSHGITSYLSSDSGNKIYFGDINMKKPLLIKPKIFGRLSRWKVGDDFKYSVWNKLNEQISSLPYLSLAKPPLLTFTNDSASLSINLAKKSSNQLDVIIGIQTDENNKTEVVADVNLLLYNIAKRTDQWELRWSTPEKNTQKLMANATLPFLFNTPFGYYFNINLLKQDSSYVKTHIKNGVAFKPNFFTTFIVYLGKENINPIGENTETIETISNQSYGISIHRIKSDDVFNPSKGLIFMLDFSQGTQQKLFQETTTTSTTFLFEGKLASFIPVFRKLILHQKAHLTKLIKDQITSEELFEVGGFSSFRGVNERIIRTPSLAYYSFNPRYRLDKHTYLSVFTDQLWFLNNSTTNYFWSVGAGFAFSTKSGIFNMNYAVANTGKGLTLKDGKIHFGYINVF